MLELMERICDTIGMTRTGVVSIVGAGGKTSLLFRLAHELSRSGRTVLTTTTTKMMMPGPEQCPHIVLAGSAEEIIARANSVLKTQRHLYAASHCLEGYKNKVVGLAPDIIDDLAGSGCFDWILSEADGAARKSLKAPAVHEPVIAKTSTLVIAVAGLKTVGKPLTPEWVFRCDRYASITGLPMGHSIDEDSIVQAAVHPEGMFKGVPEKAQKILFLNTTGDDNLIPVGKKTADRLHQMKNRENIHGVIIGSPKESPPVKAYHILSG